jgi:transposase
MSSDLYQLRCLTRELESLHQVKTGFTNQLHALAHTQFVNKSTQKRIQQLVKNLQSHINTIEKEMVDANAALKQGIENITQMKGVALISAATVVAETNGFLLMENLKQVVSYAGYDVVENQSEKRAGKTSISKKGNIGPPMRPYSAHSVYACL